MTPSSRYWYMPIAVGLLIFLISLGLWAVVWQRDVRSLALQSESVAEEIVFDLGEEFRSKLGVFASVFKELWLNTNETSDLLSPSRWVELIPAFYNFFEGYLAVNLLDANDTVRMVYPLEGNSFLINQSLSRTADGMINTALAESHRTGEVQVTSFITFYQGGSGVATYIPFFYNGTLYGFINLALRTAPLFSGYYLSHEFIHDFGFRILEGGKQVYETSTDLVRNDQFSQDRNFSFYNKVWGVEVHAKKHLVEKVAPYRTMGIALVGFLVLVLAIYANLVLEQRRRRQQEEEQLVRQYERAILQMERLRTLGEMVGGVAHNFNNLLMSLHGNATLATMHLSRANPKVSKAIEKLEEMERILEDSRDITSSILMFARQSSAQMSVVDVGEVVESAGVLVKPRLQKLEIHKIGAPVLANFSMLQQVFVNILSNAIDASPVGPRVVVTMELISFSVTGRDAVEVRVVDNGKGMSEKVLERIFNPFFTTKAMGEGTGLGMTLAQQYITDLGGVIRVSSWEGVGTTVAVIIPVVEGGKANGGAEVELDGSGLSVLLVEDSSSIRDFLEELLVTHNFSVTAYSSAEEVDAVACDIAILDINLPGVSGIEFYHQLRKRSDPKVVFITGYAESSTQIPSADNVRVLYKPFSPGGLFEILSDMLSPSR